jgi:hypothetical protein
VSTGPAAVPALDALAEHCWRRLAEAVDDRADPWRTPAIGTRSETGVALRTVVLRSAETASRALLLHTDVRSAKAGELLRSPRLSWLFWDSRSQEQLRCEGPATLHREDPLAEAQWRNLPTTSRANYRQPAAPGTAVDGRTAYPDDGDDDESAFLRFLVVRCRVETMDWLRLHRDGHHRARLSWSARRWHAGWVAP